MSGRAHPVLAFAVALVALAGAVLWRTSAVFVDTEQVPGNTFTTSDCFQARVNQVLTGQTTSTANGIVTVPISAVDPTRSFLMFGTRHDLNRPVGSEIRGRIADTTTLEFGRATDEIAPVTITIRWYVIEYACGVRVQRGQVTQSGGVVNVPIAPVAALSQAFVTWSKTPDPTDQAWDQDDPVIMELTSTSNLQLRANAPAPNHIIWWQVVEFTNPGDILVQRGTTNLTGGALSTSPGVPTPVNVGRTFVMVDYRTSGSGADIGARMLRARLINSTTITIDRSVAGSPDNITEIQWQAVELKDGSRVRRGNANLAAGVAAAAYGIPAIDPSRAAAFTSVQNGGGQNAGRSPYAGDDIPGVGAVTATLTATTVTLTRTSTVAAANIGWFVVEWGGPSWWNVAYDWRKAITVASGGPAVPNMYSVSLTFDHAALVSAGKARADGDDVRVLYWNGATWTQRARILYEGSAWNSATTTIWFRTQGAIAAGGSNSNYFLYYGNPSAGSPPTNPSNVFLFFDAFPGPGLGPSYTVLRPPAAGWSVGGGLLNINHDPNENFWAGTNTAALFHIAAPAAGDFEAQASQLGRPTADGHTGGILAYQNDDNYIANYHTNIAGTESLAYVREAAAAPTSQTQGVSSDPIHLRIRKLGTTYTGYYSTDGGVTFAPVGTPQVIALAPIRIGLTAFSSSGNVMTMSFDEFRVRRLVNPEPATSLGIEDRS